MRIVCDIDKAHFGNEVELCADAAAVCLIHMNTVVSIVIGHRTYEITNSGMSNAHFYQLNKLIDELKAHTGVRHIRTLIADVKSAKPAS